MTTTTTTEPCRVCELHEAVSAARGSHGRGSATHDAALARLPKLNAAGVEPGHVGCEYASYMTEVSMGGY